MPAVARSLDLDPTDRLWVTYAPRPVIPRPEPTPFDLGRCLKELDRTRDYSNTRWFDKVRASERPSPAEGHFWFAALELLRGRASLSVAKQKLRRMTFDGSVTDEEFMRPFHRGDAQTSAYVPLGPAARGLLTPERFLRILAGGPIGDSLPAWALFRWEVGEAVRRVVVPAMSDAELDRARELLRPRVSVRHWPVVQHDAPPTEFYLAAACGLSRELESVVRTWPDGGDADALRFANAFAHHRIVFALGSAAAVELHLRRLKFQLLRPEYVRAWLAHTGWSGLDVVRDGVLTATRKDAAEALVRELARVQAPETAPIMLELMLDSKAPSAAREWLTANPDHAVAGLMQLASGKGKLAQAALEYLRDTKRKGQTALVEEHLKGATPELAAFVRLAVLEREEKVYAALADDALPAGLRAALDKLAPKKGALPAWLDVAALPPLLVGSGRLPDARVKALVAALKGDPPLPGSPLVVALKKHANPASLDGFAWHLFELWLREGMPTKEKWAFVALGLLGGDASALKLTPLVREWPGMHKHPAAVLGLEVLRAIGTDAALMQLNAVSQKVKFQGVKKKAGEMMEAIAADRGLTRAELEDRIVPDLDLDENGGRTLDFGPRQFRVALDANLSPVVRDADGKVRPDLPKPGQKDDPEKSAAAVAEWKLLKKQLREVLKLQAPRLEQAMVTMRRWPVAEFEALLVRHPLMTNLARRLVWGGYAKSGQLTCTFRVTDEKDYAGSDDKSVKLAQADAVGIVHPLHLDEPAKAAWGQLLGEYEVIPPFPQLGRPVYRLAKGEEKATDLAGHCRARVPGGAMWGTTEKLGWARGSSSDHGVVTEFVKWFPAAGVTAVLQIEPGIARGVIDLLGDTQRTTACFFRAGRYDSLAYPTHKAEHRRPLGEVDPVAVSEVLADLHTLAGKGT